MAVSYEKFVIDEEIISRMMRIMEGIDPVENDFNVDILQEVGHDGSFLMHPTTFEACRNVWMPTVSNWDLFETWKDEGGEDVLSRAHRRYQKVLSECPESMIDATQDRALQKYIENQ